MFFSTIIGQVAAGLGRLTGLAPGKFAFEGDHAARLDRASSCLPEATEADRLPEHEAGKPRLLLAPRRVLVVGAGKVGHLVAETLESQGYEVVGFADDPSAPFLTNGWPLLGDRDSVPRLVREHRIDRVIVTYAPTWQEQLVGQLMQNQPEVQVSVVPSHYESLLRTPRVGSFGGVAVANLTEPRGRIWDWAKRLIDVACAAAALILLSPVLLFTAAMVKLSSPGPVLYIQERVGKAGRVFRLLKFRTMRDNAESETGPVLSSGKTDARLTRIGGVLRRYRLDELPQLWNVLRGDMSLVGPRPERPCFVQVFTAQTPLYNLRHEVRPGITGLAQVHGGYLTDSRDKLRFDLIYLAHRSLWLDLKILAMTARVVLHSEGS